jgi:hypothetical protein
MKAAFSRAELMAKYGVSRCAGLPEEKIKGDRGDQARR